jgi:hypothetical protein
MKNLRSVKRHSGALPFRVLIDNIAATLARDGKAKLFQDGTYLAGAQARELGRQTAISTVERLTET